MLAIMLTADLFFGNLGSEATGNCLNQQVFIKFIVYQTQTKEKETLNISQKPFYATSGKINHRINFLNFMW